MAKSLNQESQNRKESFLQRKQRALNTFKVGFASGILLTGILIGGSSHLLFNVFRIGRITFDGDADVGTIGSTNESNQETNNPNQAGGSMGQGQANTGDADGDINQVQNGDTGDGTVSNAGGTITAGGDVTFNNYNSNEDLPGFNPNSGYQTEPADIGDFNDALLITDVSFGKDYAVFATNDIFINKRKYTSSFYLSPNRLNPTRVGFNLEGTPRPSGLLLQFGLGDWDSGTTTLTYLVQIYGDGAKLWSNQVKYEESQIVSVVLDVEEYSDIIIEYQVVEQGSASIQRNPLYFTDAKLLFN